MPSFDTAKLHAMGQQLLQASQNADWSRLQQLDDLLQQWVQAVQGRAMDAVERQAWQHMMQLHAQALQRCQIEKEAVAAQLRSLHNSQEAQKAYAWQEILG